MTDKPKVWIHPNGHALGFLKNREDNSRRESSGTTQALAKPVKPEILPPEKSLAQTFDISKVVPTPPPPADIGPQLDAAVRRFENLLETALQTFDLNEREGFLDEYIFERKDHRLAVKIARSAATNELLENFVKTLDLFKQAEGQLRSLNRSQQQEFIERVNLAHTAQMAYHRLQYAPAAAQRQEASEDAKARELVGDCEGKIREHSLRGRPQPPAPPAPPPVDTATLKKEAARRERRDKIELDQEMKQEQADAAQEQVAQAKTKCIAIFGDVHIRAGEMRARIQKVLDAYKVDASILPSAIQDFMEEGLPEDAL